MSCGARTEAGASGFVLEGFVRRGPHRGRAGGCRRRRVVRPGVAPLLDRYRRLVASRCVTRPGSTSSLDREHDVLRLMARGATNAEIAAALFAAEATVKTHVGSIFGKLGVRDRAAAIVFAYDHGASRPAPSRRSHASSSRGECGTRPGADAEGLLEVYGHRYVD